MGDPVQHNKKFPFINNFIQFAKLTIEKCQVKKIHSKELTLHISMICYIIIDIDDKQHFNMLVFGWMTAKNILNNFHLYNPYYYVSQW